MELKQLNVYGSVCSPVFTRQIHTADTHHFAGYPNCGSPPFANFSFPNPPPLVLPVSPAARSLVPCPSRLRASREALVPSWPSDGVVFRARRGSGTWSSAACTASSPTEDLAAFYVLVEKRVKASVLSRFSRDAELCDRAAKHAGGRLWGDNSLVVAHLRFREADALRNLAHASTSFSEQEVLLRRAWAILVPVHALLLRRLADNMLLPGTIKEEEVMYGARTEAFLCKAMDQPDHTGAFLQSVGVVFGYATLLDAVYVTLALLGELQGSALSRESAHSFVLTALDAIPRTATMQNRLMSEADLVVMMKTHMKPQNFEPSFCAAMLRKWRSSAVADVLRARGVLQTGVAATQDSIAASEARQRADIEKIGLRECAWPSCDKVERTVREFKQCSGYRSV